MRNMESIMEASVYQVMNWMLMELLRVGLLLGLENELSDLKGLVSFSEMSEGEFVPVSQWQLNVDLLNSLESKDIDLLRDSMNLIYDCQEKYRLINDIVPEELVHDQSVADQAASLYEFLADGGRAYDGQADLQWGITNLHQDCSFVLFLCARMFKRNSLEVCEGDDPFQEYCEAYHEIELEASEDRNVKLLYGLINELNGQHDKWMDYNIKTLRNG